MQQLNNNHVYSDSNNEDQIDIKEIVSIILNYKRSILLITFITTLFTFFYAYFSPNIYQANALIKIVSGKFNNSQDDLITKAMGRTESNIDDEIVIFKTHNIAKKSLKNLNLGIRYYTTKNFKSYELYKDSPFVVTTASMTAKAGNARFELIPIDEKTFRLTITPPLKSRIINTLRSFISSSNQEKRYITYSKIHQFGKIIETVWFTINIQKIHQLSEKEYFFTMTQNEYMSRFIQGRISASLYTKFGNFITLNFRDTVPLRAKEILEAVTHTYIKENLNLKSESIKKKLYFVDIQLKAINETLKGSAQKLQSYKATNIVIDLNQKAHIASTKLSDLESELYRINLHTDVMESMLNYMNVHKDIKGIDIDSALQASSIVGNTIVKIQEERILLSSLLTKYTEDHPNVITVTKRLNFMKGSLKDTIINSLAALNKRKLSLKNIIIKSKGLLQTLPEQEQKLEQLTRNFIVNEKIYSFLLQKRAEIAIAESSIISDTRIVEEPVVSRIPIKPKRTSIIFIGMIIGLILGISLAFFRNFLDNTIKNIEDVEKLTNMPIYGGVPVLSTKNALHYEEAMRVLWSNLEFSKIQSRSKIITFTSSISGEGKTLTISQLGNIIAKSTKSVIILDLDMRKAKLHEIYKLSNTTGMSTLLANRSSLEESIQDIHSSNLKIITSGPIPPHPTSLIMSDKLEHIIDALQKQYDYILIDSPPIGLVADAMKIMHISDITLILLKANVSKKNFIKNITRLTKDPKINTGIILNGIKLDKDYGYGYGYGYGY